MSLAIQLDDVTEVLLVDGWHEVLRKSFLLDSYEYLDGDFLVQGGGQHGICALGFAFTTDGEVLMAGPLSAVLAIRKAPTKEAA